MSIEDIDFSINNVAYKHYKQCEDKVPKVTVVKDTKTLNQYIEAGHAFCIVERVICELLMTYKMVFQMNDTGLVESFVVGKHKETGEWIDIRDRRFDAFKPINEYLENDKLLAQHEYYQGRHPNDYPWGAYVLPLGIQDGDKVYIEELIEDISSGGFWGLRTRFGNAVGQWDGEKIVLDERISEDAFWGSGIIG